MVKSLVEPLLHSVINWPLPIKSHHSNKVRIAKSDIGCTGLTKSPFMLISLHFMFLDKYPFMLISYLFNII